MTFCSTASLAPQLHPVAIHILVQSVQQYQTGNVVLLVVPINKYLLQTLLGESVLLAVVGVVLCLITSLMEFSRPKNASVSCIEFDRCDFPSPNSVVNLVVHQCCHEFVPIHHLISYMIMILSRNIMQATSRIKQWKMPWLLETPPVWLCRSQEPVPVGSAPIVRYTRYQWAILWVGGEPEHRWTRGESEILADTYDKPCNICGMMGAWEIYDKSVWFLLGGK